MNPYQIQSFGESISEFPGNFSQMPSSAENSHLFDAVMKNKWNNVLALYVKYQSARTEKLTKSNQTALHIAISCNHPESKNRSLHLDEHITKMINAIPDEEAFEVLKSPDINGNTPLHLAAAWGYEPLCRRIAEKCPKVTDIKNKDKETPLYMAVHHGRLDAYRCLRDECRLDQEVWMGKNGDTILHAAIRGEYFRLAFEIIDDCRETVDRINVNGETPLHVLAKKPNYFFSSCNLRFYDSIVYHCVPVQKLKRKDKQNTFEAKKASFKLKPESYPSNYRTCVNILDKVIYRFFEFISRSLGRSWSCSNDDERVAKDEENQRDNVHKDDRYPHNYATCVLFCQTAVMFVLVVFGMGYHKIKRISEKKDRHTWATQIMNKLLKIESKSYKYTEGQDPEATGLSGGYRPPLHRPLVGDDKPEPISDSESISDPNETPFLIAAKMGIVEMVEAILNKFRVALYDLDAKKKNALLLAIEYRQTRVFNFFIAHDFPDFVLHQVDNEGNSARHLSALFNNPNNPWRLPGSALQMHGEVTWFKHVKKSLPSSLRFAHYNNNGETPRDIFKRTHEDLAKVGTDWLIKTSESCSLVAALIATVAFATSATVPGGVNDTGLPTLSRYALFNLFSVASLFALCFSLTALVFFLAIITSRCQVWDFKKNLPRKLLMGLSSLFTSIAAILVSFCAGHFFVLTDNLRYAALPIYTVTSVPLTIFAFAQLPLYFDLLRAVVTQEPVRSYKVSYRAVATQEPVTSKVSNQAVATQEPVLS